MATFEGYFPAQFSIDELHQIVALCKQKASDHRYRFEIDARVDSIQILTDAPDVNGMRFTLSNSIIEVLTRGIEDPGRMRDLVNELEIQISRGEGGDHYFSNGGWRE